MVCIPFLVLTYTIVLYDVIHASLTVSSSYTVMEKSYIPVMWESNTYKALYIFIISDVFGENLLFAFEDTIDGSPLQKLILWPCR